MFQVTKYLMSAGILPESFECMWSLGREIICDQNHWLPWKTLIGPKLSSENAYSLGKWDNQRFENQLNYEVHSVDTFTNSCQTTWLNIRLTCWWSIVFTVLRISTLEHRNSMLTDFMVERNSHHHMVDRETESNWSRMNTNLSPQRKHAPTLTAWFNSVQRGLHHYAYTNWGPAECEKLWKSTFSRVLIKMISFFTQLGKCLRQNWVLQDHSLDHEWRPSEKSGCKRTR